MKKTIGGNRLGAGGKMTTEMHNYGRSTHDTGAIWRSSMAPGTLVPFLVEIGLPGDTFDIKLNADVKTHPTLGPLFGSFKLQLDIFEAPMRLYHAGLMQNSLNIGNNMSAVLLPQINQLAIPIKPVTPNYQNPDNQQIEPSCILSYLGIRGWGFNTTGLVQARSFFGIPFLAYWEIYKNYYANKQETIGSYITSKTPTAQTVTTITFNAVTLSGSAGTSSNLALMKNANIIITFSGTVPDPSQIMVYTTSLGVVPITQLATFTQTSGTTFTSDPGTIYPLIGLMQYWQYAVASQLIQVATFPLTNIDNMKATILAQSSLVQLKLDNTSPIPYGDPLNIAKSTSSQCGLGIKTYQSDLFNNWMQSTWQTNIQTATNISTAGGFFTVDTLILSRKLYDLLNRIAMSGGSYMDWLDASYAHKPYSSCISPMYHGGLSKEVIFQEVINMSPQQLAPLGTLAGRGTMSNKHKGGAIHIKVDEPSVIIGIVSLTPRIDYSQGNRWFNNIQNMDNLHKPALDQIGFQNLITEQLAWWDTQIGLSGAVTTRSAGLQPMWMNYMTNVNETFGNFANINNEMFMTLNRRYTMNPSTNNIQDLTTYIDPSHYNFIFAQTSLDSQNFWVQIAKDVTARRKMSAKIMPNL